MGHTRGWHGYTMWLYDFYIPGVTDSGNGLPALYGHPYRIRLHEHDSAKPVSKQVTGLADLVTGSRL